MTAATCHEDRVAMDDGVRLWVSTSSPATAAVVAPVVLVHGGPGLWDYLEPVEALVADLAVVHRYDQRGCGRSDPSEDQRLARLVADLEALREHLGHRRWVLVGHSFGATLALRYAVTHADRVAGLGYLSGVGLDHTWKDEYRRERARRMSGTQQARLSELAGLPDRSPAQERELRALAWFTDSADVGRAWEWAQQDAAVPFPVNMAANKIINAETEAWTPAQLGRLREQCRRLSVPALVVHGAQDPRPSRQAVDLASTIPGSELHVLDGAGHAPWRERPEQLGAVLRGWLSRLPHP